MKYITDYNLFLDEQKLRLSSYYSSNKINFTGFGSKENFIAWYLRELKVNDCKCHYCKTSIFDLRRLLNNDLIGGRSVKGNGLRGPNFEVDRKNPFGKYEESNCVLSCYYCNNDKSNTFDYQTYLNIISPVKGQAWKVLLNRIKATSDL